MSIEEIYYLGGLLTGSIPFLLLFVVLAAVSRVQDVGTEEGDSDL